MHTFATPAPVSAVLNVPAGRIRIIAADRADTTVEVVPADSAKKRDVRAAERTTVSYADGVLRVEAPPAENEYLGRSGAIEVTVQLPTASNVETTAACVGFRSAGRLGEVVCEGADGTNGVVEIDEAASLRLTAFGGVSVGRLAGAAEISTQKGDVHIAEAVSGTVVLTTRMGNVTVGAAAGVSASLDAGTSSGRIRNDLANADGAGAALTIRATTDLGDITARSL